MTDAGEGSIVQPMQTATAAKTSARWNLTMTFEMNGKGYKTDAETLAVLNSIVPSAKAANDFSAVMFLMDLGLESGRVVQMTAKERKTYK